jgi:hypothetical protein
MTNEDIYTILASKSHNSHYLKRYFKFILWCQENQLSEDYTEEHHICPKANDLFPEYISFKDHPWNISILTTKQHLITHVMLWKAYPKSSMSMALECMLGNFNSETNSLLAERKVPTAFRLRYLAKTRKDASDRRSEFMTGKGVYKDKDGNRFLIENSDPRIVTEGLVGIRSGTKNSEESGEKHRATKFKNKKIVLYFFDKKVKVKLFSPEYDSYISQGWHQELTDEDREYIKQGVNEKTSLYWTGRMRYMTQDGVYHGSYLKDDPIISQLQLTPLRTEAQITQNASRTALASEARTGTNIYNNGIEEKFLFEPIDKTWFLGRLPRCDEWEEKRKAASSAAVKGKKTYNNGLTNRFFAVGEPIPEGFVPGMKPRKK